MYNLWGERMPVHCCWGSGSWGGPCPSSSQEVSGSRPITISLNCWGRRAGYVWVGREDGTTERGRCLRQCSVLGQLHTKLCTGSASLSGCTCRGTRARHAWQDCSCLLPYSPFPVFWESLAGRLGPHLHFWVIWEHKWWQSLSPHCYPAGGAYRLCLSGLQPFLKHPTPGFSSTMEADGELPLAPAIVAVSCAAAVTNACVPGGWSEEGLPRLHRCCAALQCWPRVMHLPGAFSQSHSQRAAEL